MKTDTFFHLFHFSRHSVHFRFEQMQRKIKCIDHNHDCRQVSAKSNRIAVGYEVYKSLQEAKHKDCIESPRYSTLQTDHTFIIKRFLRIIPLDLSKQISHKHCRNIFKHRSKNRARQIKHHILAFQRTKHAIH